MKKRLLKVENLRIFAMICVLINHTIISALHIFDYSNLLIGAYLSYFIHVLVRVAIPIFFIISGYLMLDDNYELPLTKLMKQIAKYLLVIAIYGTCFAWIEMVFEERSISILQIPKALYGAFTGNTWDHMWFLYAYVGLLFALPVFRTFWIYAQADAKTFVLCAGIILTSVLSKLNCGIAFQISGVHAICFMFGGLLKDREKSGKFYASSHKRILVGILFLNAALLAIMTYCYIYLGQSNLSSWLNARSVFIVIPAMITATLFINRDNKDFLENRVLKIMSSTSFGVYIYHMVWVNVLYKVVKVNPFSHGLAFMFLILALNLIFIYIASILTTLITKKIPGIKKLI